MNKLLNNLLGMYKQAKLKKSAMIIDEILDRKDGASYNPQDFYDYVSQQLDVLNSKDIATALDSGTEEDVKKALCEYIKLGEYNPAICDYINSVNWLEEEDVEKWFSIKLSDEQAKEFAKLLTEYGIKNKSEEEGEEIKVSFFILPSSKGIVMGLLSNTLSRFPDKQAKMNKNAEEKESAKKDYTEQYAKVKEIMKEYGYGLSDGGYIYLISKEEPKDEGFQVKFKGDRLRVELDGKLKYSGYGPEAIEDFLKGMFYAKKLSSKNTKLTKKAKEYGISDYLNHFNDVQQYVLTENKGDLGKAVEDLLGFASSEYDKARFPREYVYKLVKEYIDGTIKFQEMIHHPIKEEYIVKAKELLNNYKVENKIASKTNKLHKQAKKESVVYYDNSLSPREDAQVHKVTYYDTTYNTWGDGNADHEFISVEQFEKETGKKIEELKEKEKITIKLAMTNRNRFGKKADLSKDFDDAESFAKKIIEENKHSFSGHTDMAKLENNASSMYFMDNADIKEILDEAKKIVSELDNDKDKKLEDADLYFGMKDRALLAEKVLEEKTKQEKQSSKAKAVRKQAKNKEIVVTYEGTNGKEYIVKAPNGLYFNEYVDTDTQHSRGAGPFETLEKAKEMFKKHRPSAKEIIVTKKQAGMDPNVSAEDILKLNFDMPIEKADKVKEQFNEKGIKYQSRKGKYTVEFSVDIEAGKVDLVYEIIRNIKKSSSTKKQATIKHENGVYNVYSESGKCLGKGYKTKEEAEKRLKQVEYFKNKKANKEDTYEEWGISGDDIDEWFENYTKAKIFFEKNKKDVKQFFHKVYDISGDEPEEIQVDVLYDRDRNINKVNFKTQQNKRTSLKQVEYFTNKKAATGYDYWGPKEMPDEDEGTFRIKYYGGPGHKEYLRKARNGKYHWKNEHNFDYIEDFPFETTDYELAKKLVEQYGGEIEKKESKQVNNKRTSLKQVVISKMAGKTRKIKFIGIDDWGKPTFKDISSKNFYITDVYNLFRDGTSEEQIKDFYKDKELNKVLVYKGQYFDSEPWGSTLEGDTLILI